MEGLKRPRERGILSTFLMNQFVSGEGIAKRRRELSIVRSAGLIVRGADLKMK
jgi:hypothetical protein